MRTGMERKEAVVRTTPGVALRVAAGLALLAYALVACIGLGKGLGPLLPAVVGAYLVLRGLTSRTVRDGGGS